jgi:hypothetical protein
MTTEIPLDFSESYGLHFSWFAIQRDSERFDVMKVDLERYLDGCAWALEQEAREEGEFDLLRPWLEYLIASDNKSILALGIECVGGLSDLILIHPGIDTLTIPQLHHVLEWVRQRLFKLDKPMTEAEKERVRREVKLTFEPLDEFRARRRAAGHLPEPP